VITDAREYFVYRMLDADGQLLYVGCTKRLDKRWSEHKSSRRNMVPQVARCRLQGPYTRPVALQIERAAIRSEEPLYGWTPTRHREKCVRTKWINERAIELVRSGAEDYSAIYQACHEAEEQFPDPDEHEYIAMGSLRATRVAS
jgi:predicted GIY-YIG superfamily endonuclease